MKKRARDSRAKSNYRYKKNEGPRKILEILLSSNIQGAETHWKLGITNDYEEHILGLQNGSAGSLFQINARVANLR